MLKIFSYSEKDRIIDTQKDDIFEKGLLLKDNERRVTDANSINKISKHVDDDEFSELINKYMEELRMTQGQMDDLNKKNEKLIEDNSRLARKLNRLTGIEEKFMQISAEKKTFDEFSMKNKELQRENKAKCLEIDS